MSEFFDKYDNKTKINNISNDELEQAKFKVEDNTIVVQTISKGDYYAAAQLTLDFWKAKGMTLTEVEDTYGFDFVVTENCVPVVNRGRLVVVKRT